MPTLTRESPAKINLTLHVRGLRPDGYHEIESLAARVRLCDTICVSPREDGRWTLECDDPAIPCDDRNLALRAALRLARDVDALDEARSIRPPPRPSERGGAPDAQAISSLPDARGGIHISIQKRIPAGAGLGGGSSNAATTLQLLNELWGLRLSNADLARIGAEIGSDVPLFLHAPLCVLRGRGEIIEDCPQRPRMWAALLLPDLHAATPAVYAAWDRLDWRRTRPAAEKILAWAGSAAELMPQLFNDLEEAAGAANPALGELLKQARLASDGPVRMTGSGAALFRLFDDEPAAQAFARHMQAALGLRAVAAPLETT